MRRPIDADGVELPPARVIDGDVVRDLEQPGRELEVRPVAVEMREDLDEGVLRQVLGELAIAHHTEDEREDWSFVPFDELTMRCVAALEGEGDDIGIGEVGEVEGAEHSGVRGPRSSETSVVAQSEKYVALTLQTRRVLAQLVAPGELSRMSQIEVEERRAELAAEGGSEKRAYVRTVFEEIAPRYDLLNHLLSLNIDRMWRRRALRALDWARKPEGRYLDLCAGTLDVGAELTRQRGFRGFIVGADFALPMLEAGKGKAPRDRLAPVG